MFAISSHINVEYECCRGFFSISACPKKNDESLMAGRWNMGGNLGFREISKYRLTFQYS